MALRLVFLGTPSFAVPTLLQLIGQGHQIAAVYTQPPRAAGRGMAARLSPVHETALGFGVPVFTPGSLREQSVQAEFASHAADAAVVVAYGLILPRSILEAPSEGCLNLHASLLPRWRGAAPIQRAIMAGDRETGVMVMRMEEGLDTGPICLAERVGVGAEETAGSLADRLAALGADLMGRALAALERGALICAPQLEIGATYANKIHKAETRIDWRLPACELVRLILALSPSPGAWCEVAIGGRPERVKVLRAARAEGSGTAGTLIGAAPPLVACGADAIRLIELQRAGRPGMPAEDFLRGARLQPGTMFG